MVNIGQILKQYSFMTFTPNVGITERIAALGGECQAKMDELTTHPIPPRAASEIERVFVSKGIEGTTAIEGGTLTAEQIREIMEGKEADFPTREHLNDEIHNVLRTYEMVHRMVQEDASLLLGGEILKRVHRMIADGLDHIAAPPGRYRTGKVVVGSVYIPPPAEAVDELVKRLFLFLRRSRFAQGNLLNGLIRAVVAHVYIAWIHPFDDGNGRTARAYEYGLLLAAGLPRVGAASLANHFNITRGLYMKKLKESSRERRGDLTDFVEYALQGLSDMLSEALATIRQQVVRAAWENYVYEEFRRHYGRALTERQARLRDLVLYLSSRGPMAIAELAADTRLDPTYRKKAKKTLQRDLAELRDKELVVFEGSKWTANKGVMNSFRLGQSVSLGAEDEDQLALPLGPRDRI